MGIPGDCVCGRYISVSSVQSGSDPGDFLGVQTVPGHMEICQRFRSGEYIIRMFSVNRDPVSGDESLVSACSKKLSVFLLCGSGGGNCYVSFYVQDPWLYSVKERGDAEGRKTQYHDRRRPERQAILF